MEIEMRVVRLIIILYGVWNSIVIMITIIMIVIINIDIQDNLVIIIPLGVIVILNTPRRSCEYDIIINKRYEEKENK